MTDLASKKKARTQAKRGFTLKLKDLNKYLMENDIELELLDDFFADVNKAWKNVEEKQENYMILVEDEDEETEGNWINSSQKEFYDVRKVYHSRKKKLEEESGRLKIVSIRDAKFKNFVYLAENMKQYMSVNASKDMVQKEMITITRTFEDVANTHSELVNSTEDDNRWYENLKKLHTKVANDVNGYMEKGSEPKTQNLQLQKLPLPKFSGDIQKYARFKGDFVDMVRPKFSSREACFALRQCVSHEVSRILDGCEENVDTMIKRLDEKYGDPSKLVEVVVSKIVKFKKLEADEEKKLIEFIDLIEYGYKDLKIIGLEKEINNSNIVSIIENKLPRSIALIWYRNLHAKDSSIDKANKFPSLLEFLCTERRSLEYASSDMRSSSERQNVRVNYMSNKDKESTCLAHGNDTHKTEECRKFLNMRINERYNFLREGRACYNCLEKGHLSTNCTKGADCVDGCDRRHHRLLHQDEGKNNVEEVKEQGNSLREENDISEQQQRCLLPIMSIKVRSSGGFVNVLWDSGSTTSLITNDAAKKYGLKGVPVKLRLTTCGGDEKQVESYRYTVSLVDDQGVSRDIKAYGIERITSDISRVDMQNVERLFKGIPVADLKRSDGSVDLLIGVEYAAWHPRVEHSVGHLLILQNQFGRCLGGSHEVMREGTQKKVMQVSVNSITLSEFFFNESLGTECQPKCGGCQCRTCPIGGKDYTIKEERELAMIKKNLKFCGDHWETIYPWVIDPQNLPDNEPYARKMLIQTEKRLSKDEERSRVYCEQMKDMLDRNVARKLSRDEKSNYKGPVHYISHHAVVNLKSQTTPVRIVFNCSHKYRGHSLNEYWAKGPDAFLNSLLGILLRFREKKIGMVADIKKMYNSVSISTMDQHCHRYLWRDMVMSNPPETYVITVVNLGDRPGGAISTVALRKTAEMFADTYPEASQMIIESTYVDDVIDCCDDKKQAIETAQQVSTILAKGNFHLKGWKLSEGVILDKDGNQGEDMGSQSDLQNFDDKNHTERVLGMRWSPIDDALRFEVKWKFGKRETDLEDLEMPTSFTKRMLISFLNGIYDPMGLVNPVISTGKVIVRKVWAHEPKLGWDDKVPEELYKEFLVFIKAVMYLKEVSFSRCVKPEEAVGVPNLVIFSDASKEIYGACCYLQWRLEDGQYACRLLLAKSRVAPLKTITIVRLELLAAVLATRMRKYILKEMRIEIGRVVHIVDSEIVRTMVQKESYGFNTFTATKVGEIQENTDKREWYWISGELNIADLITKNAKPEDLGRDTVWQKGPAFGHVDVSEWPILQTLYTEALPERCEVSLVVERLADVQCAIKVERFSKYLRLMYTTGRLLSVKGDRPYSFRYVGNNVTAGMFKKAVTLWIKVCQKPMVNELKMATEGKGRFRKLCPMVGDDDVFVVGGRAVRWNQMSYDKRLLPILPGTHRFCLLYARYVHEKAHLGVDADVAKVRSEFWIVGIRKIIKSIRENCVICKKRYLDLASQRMGKLPMERLKPAPPWHHTMVDLFGPFKIKGEVNKRSSMSVYGVIFTDLLTRAVHLDISSDYSTDSFLLVFRKFVSLRGFPAVVFSDQGTQLSRASKELNPKDWDWKRIMSVGVNDGLEWRFSPADSPWWNGCAEGLIRSVKKAISLALGEQVVRYSELQTIVFEAANMVNGRPIGLKPDESSDQCYLSPNDILLGRSTSKVPDQPFDTNNNLSKRYRFVQSLAEEFWRIFS